MAFFLQLLVLSRFRPFSVSHHQSGVTSTHGLPAEGPTCMADKRPPRKSQAHISSQSVLTGLLFAQLGFFLSMAENGVSQNLDFHKTFHGLTRRN